MVMLIVQISDVHFGHLFNAEAFRTAIKEINGISPDVIVITGDITEDGVKSEFETAAKEFK